MTQQKSTHGGPGRGQGRHKEMKYGKRMLVLDCSAEEFEQIKEAFGTRERVEILLAGKTKMSDYNENEISIIQQFQDWQRARKALDIAKAEVGIENVDEQLIRGEESAWLGLTGCDYNTSLPDIITAYPFLQPFLSS